MTTRKLPFTQRHNARPTVRRQHRSLTLSSLPRDHCLTRSITVTQTVLRTPHKRANQHTHTHARRLVRTPQRVRHVERKIKFIKLHHVARVRPMRMPPSHACFLHTRRHAHAPSREGPRSPPCRSSAEVGRGVYLKAWGKRIGTRSVLILSKSMKQHAWRKIRHGAPAHKPATPRSLMTVLMPCE